MEDIYSLAVSASIPSLFNQEEKDEIVKALRHEATEQGVKEKIFEEFFQKRAKDNIHLLMTISPVGNLLRNLYRDFPQFVNQFQLLWMEAWPQEAMMSIGQRFLDKNMNFKDSRQSIDAVCKVSVSATDFIANVYDRYQSASRKRVYLTPSLYIDYLVTFQAILEKIT